MCVVLILCEYEGYMLEFVGCVVRFEICMWVMIFQMFYLSNGNIELVWMILYSSVCVWFQMYVYVFWILEKCFWDVWIE